MDMHKEVFVMYRHVRKENADENARKSFHDMGVGSKGRLPGDHSGRQL